MHNTQYTFTGLPDVYDRMMMDVAGAARTPVTKLFGRSPCWHERHPERAT